MKTQMTLFAAATWLCCVSLSSADTIILKNGDKIEGHVLREVDGNYVLEIKVSDTIRDEKTIAKSDVKFIEKEGDDLKVFKKLEKLVPTPEMLDAEDYEARIEKIEAFISEHSKSSCVPKAKEMLEILSAELVVIRSGGIKFGEEMIAAEDYLSNAYEIDSVIAAKRIKEYVGRGDFIRALRAFTKYDETFKGADGRAATVKLIKQVLSAYGNSIEENLASFDRRVEKRKNGLASMAPEDRVKTERALAEQEERIAARFEKEKDAREPWITPDAFNKESLEEARRQVESESKRLESVEKSEELVIPVAEAYRVAWTKLSSATDQEKSTVISEAQASGIPAEYLNKLREHAGIAAP